ANEVSATMPAGLGAGAMAVSPDGAALYVANAAAGTVTVIALAERSQQAVIRVGQDPAALTLGALGRLLFASDAGSDDVAAIRAQDATSPNSLITLLPSPPTPGFAAILRP
ncbi:MAG: YncE family protein, partial [Terriglobales bacterium]